MFAAVLRRGGTTGDGLGSVATDGSTTRLRSRVPVSRSPQVDAEDAHWYVCHGSSLVPPTGLLNCVWAAFCFEQFSTAEGLHATTPALLAEVNQTTALLAQLHAASRPLHPALPELDTALASLGTLVRQEWTALRGVRSALLAVTTAEAHERSLAIDWLHSIPS